MANRKFGIGLLLLCSFYQLQAQNNHVFPYYNGQKWGLTNEKLELLAQPRYDTVGYISNPSQLFTYVQLNGKYGHIDRSGKALYTPQFDTVGNLYATEAASYSGVKKGGKWGYVALPSGKLVCPLIYDRVSDYGLDKYPWFVQVFLKNKTGLANLKTGKLFCAAEYDELHHLEKQLLSLRKGKLWTLAHLQKGILGKPRFESIEYRWEQGGLYEARRHGKVVYFDEEGRTMAAMPVEGGMVGAKGDPVYEDPGSNYRSRVYHNGGKSWKVVIEKRVNSYNPATIVKTFELDGYDELELLYDNVENKEVNATIYLKAKKQGSYGAIDMTGKEYIPFEYTDLRKGYGHFMVTKEGLLGVYSRDFKQIFSPMFTYVQLTEDGFLRVDLATGRKGYAGLDGKLYIPAKE